MPMLFLAVDQSTSATKALLFDGRGQIVDRESREHRQHYPQPGWVEHDAAEIWANTITSLRALLARHAGRTAEIMALSLTNQRETVVVFDRATGEPLAPAMVWQCRRGGPLCAALQAAGHEPMVQERTGLKIDAYFSASKLQWLLRHRPDLGARLSAGTALIGTIDTYLIFRLTHGKVFATDSSNASRTLLFNLATLQWDEELCELWEVPVRALPEIRESTACFGMTTLEGILDRPVPICGVMGDSQAALFAQGCLTPGAAKITLGTGSSLLLNIGSQLRRSTRGVVTTLAWVHDGVPTYAFEGIIISAASTFTWLRDQLGVVRDVAELERLASLTPDNGGVYFVPAFTGLGLPHWQPDARALITGLSSHSDRGHVARAAFESIPYQIRDALDAMREEAGVALGSLHVDGGPTASHFLMQLTADLTGATLRVGAVAECSALGAMRAAQVGLGLTLADAARPASVSGDLVYTPALPEAAAAQLRAGWHQALARALAH